MTDNTPDSNPDWTAALTGELGDDMQHATMKVFIQQHVDSMLGRIRFVASSPDTAALHPGDSQPFIFQP